MTNKLTKSILLIAVLFITVDLFAQGCFMNTVPNRAITYINYDAKGNNIGHFIEIMKEIDVKYDALGVYQGRVYATQQFFDAKGNDILNGEKLVSVMEAKDRKFHVTLDGVKKALKTAELQQKGNNMTIPADVVPGDTIPDLLIKVDFNKSLGGTITSKERKVLAYEKVTVKAGTFDAYKISERITTKVLVINAEFVAVSWFVKGVGCVKQLSYDKKGHLVSSLEASAVTQGK